MMEHNWKGLGLDARLSWVASQVRVGVCVIDVGTDHARLPIALVKSGKTQQAIAADVASEPLRQAYIHIAKAQLTDHIDTVLSDGLQHIDLPETADITICGMGGDTIIDIIANKPQLKHKDIRLIVQPQTNMAPLRQFLAEQGFETVEETILEAEGKIYQAWVAAFTGRSHTLEVLEAEVGALNVKRGGPVLLKYLTKRRHVVQQWQQAKQAAAQNTDIEQRLLAAYATILPSK